MGHSRKRGIASFLSLLGLMPDFVPSFSTAILSRPVRPGLSRASTPTYRTRSSVLVALYDLASLDAQHGDVLLDNAVSF